MLGTHKVIILRQSHINRDHYQQRFVKIFVRGLNGLCQMEDKVVSKNAVLKWIVPSFSLRMKNFLQSLAK